MIGVCERVERCYQNERVRRDDEDGQFSRRGETDSCLHHDPLLPTASPVALLAWLCSFSSNYYPSTYFGDASSLPLPAHFEHPLLHTLQTSDSKQTIWLGLLSHCSHFSFTSCILFDVFVIMPSLKHTISNVYMCHSFTYNWTAQTLFLSLSLSGYGLHWILLDLN